MNVKLLCLRKLEIYIFYNIKDRELFNQNFFTPPLD